MFTLLLKRKVCGYFWLENTTVSYKLIFFPQVQNLIFHRKATQNDHIRLLYKFENDQKKFVVLEVVDMRQLLLNINWNSHLNNVQFLGHCYLIMTLIGTFLGARMAYGVALWIDTCYAHIVNILQLFPKFIWFYSERLDFVVEHWIRLMFWTHINFVFLILQSTQAFS